MANEFVARKGIISPKLTTTLNASSKTLTISGETTYSSTNAQVAVTNGNVHIDPCTGFNLYLNYYTGNSVVFGNSGPASVSAAGAFTGISFNSITALSSTTPAALGVAAVGSSTTVARADHVHLLPTLATLGAVGGSGTINYIPKFTSTSALGNSRITDDATWIYLSSNSVNVGQSPSYINITSNWIQVTSGGTFSVYGNQTLSGYFSYSKPAATTITGEIVYYGTGTTTAGVLYYLNTSLVWTLTDADAVASASGMLGIAIGTNPATNGMLIRGFARFSSSPYTTMTGGQILYLSVTAGEFTATAPSGTGDIVRVIGYCVDATNDTLYFNPDNTWIEVV